jgi:hypothetical protein
MVLACRKPPSPDDPRVTGWKRVVALKQVARASGKADDRQRYADAVIAYLREHPDHPRARSVYQELQLEHARELAARGSIRPAIDICKHVIRTFPDNDKAREELTRLTDLLEVSQAELAEIENGMDEKRVVELLGSPPNGWRRQARKSGKMIESMFYRNDRDGVAAVHLENGRVFAVDYDSKTPLTPESRGVVKR